VEFPANVFNGDYLKTNVLIHADEDILREEIGRLEGYFHFAEIYGPEYEKQVLKLRASLAALRAFRDTLFSKEKKRTS
jgi:hypothetical protein